MFVHWFEQVRLETMNEKSMMRMSGPGYTYSACTVCRLHQSETFRDSQHLLRAISDTRLIADIGGLSALRALIVVTVLKATDAEMLTMLLSCVTRHLCIPSRVAQRM